MGLEFRSTSVDAWSVDGDRVAGTAGARTDLFIDPETAEPTLNGPRMLAPAPRGDFQLSARVDVAFAATFDAGALLVWADQATWGKLCFEFSPQREGMAVSVVTRGVSDDANGFTVDGTTLWLRLSRRRGAYAFHASPDGGVWHFVRQFSLGDAAAEIGFEVQSPLGEGVSATFTELRYRETALADLRDGS